jgi:ribosome-binding factor A
MTIVGHRRERIAEEIHNELNLMLAGDLKDPRLAIEVNITEVRVSPDMRKARIFVQVPGTPAEREAALAGLAAASGYIRHELVDRLRLRRAPEVFFHLDDTEETGRRIEELLRGTTSSNQG